MTNVVEVRELTKQYGNKLAVDHIAFTVKEGSCFGLLGPNGAGKSTTMKMITGITEATDGEIKVFGLDARKNIDSIRKQIGYVPQEITLFDKLSAQQNLVFFGELYGVKGEALQTRIREVLEEVGLSVRAKDAIKTFSGGMKRRINIAAALLHNPKFVILDEPTVGIDPQSRNHIFEMIRGLNKKGVTVIYSTHYMEEVEALCDDIAIIDNGKVIKQGNLDDLLEQYSSNTLYVEANGLEEMPMIPEIKKTTRDGRGWILETNHLLKAMEEVAKQLEANNVKVKELKITRPSLEKVFLSLTGTSLRD